MRPAAKLLLIAGVGREMYERWRFSRILSLLATVAVLGIVAAILLSALVVAGMYATYVFLLSQGMAPAMALLTTSLITLLLAATMMLAIRQCVRKLRHQAHTPLKEAVDAFFDGLFAE